MVFRKDAKEVGGRPRLSKELSRQASREPRLRRSPGGGRSLPSRLGATALACLVAVMTFGSADAQTPDDVKYLKYPVFKIPFEVKANRLSQIKELRLFVSTDQGQSWNLVKTSEPTQSDFTFRAQGDGEYWFSLAYVNQAGEMEPRDERKLAPGLKVILDTKAPSLELKALPREEGKMGVMWRIRDEEKLNLSSFKLEARSEKETTWQEIPVKQMREGEHSWPANSSERYQIRARVRDRAGNESIAQVEMPGRADSSPPLAGMTRERPSTWSSPEGSSASTSGVSTTGVVASNSAAASETHSAAVAPASSTAMSAAGATPSRLPFEEGAFVVPAPPAVAAVAQNQAMPIPRANPRAAMPSASTRVHEVQRPVFDRSRPDLPAERSVSPDIQQVGSGVPEASNAVEPLAGTPIASNRSASAGSSPAAASPPDPVRKPFLSGSRSFAVDYSIRNVGPAGIAKVELYMTKDNGQTWKLHAEDSDRTPPFDVEVPEEGRYGFRVVVVSPSGWQKAPKPGDKPQVVVEVDTTAPKAELYELTPDPSANESLLIRWDATDKHLTSNPVSLYYGENPDGPWWAIKESLPARGQFSWLVPQGIPYKVYLRMNVRDAAGNLSRAQTKEPVLIDFSRPEAEVLTVLPSDKIVR